MAGEPSGDVVGSVMTESLEVTENVCSGLLARKEDSGDTRYEEFPSLVSRGGCA